MATKWKIAYKTECGVNFVYQKHMAHNFVEEKETMLTMWKKIQVFTTR